MLTTWHHLSAKFGTNFANRGGRSVGIVRSRTQATEFVLFVVFSLTETDPVSETLYIFLVLRILNDEQSPKTESFCTSEYITLVKKTVEDRYL
jgi:hypothetical protein